MMKVFRTTKIKKIDIFIRIKNIFNHKIKDKMHFWPPKLPKVAVLAPIFWK